METGELYQKLGIPDLIRKAGQDRPSEEVTIEPYYGGGNQGLPPPDGGFPWQSGGPGMEARVAVLEAHVEHIRGDLAKLSNVPTDLAVLKTRVDHLPTKGWMVTGLLGSLAAIAALIAYAEKIQALVS